MGSASQYHEFSTLIGPSHHQEILQFLMQTFTDWTYGKLHELVLDISLNETACSDL